MQFFVLWLLSMSSNGGFNNLSPFEVWLSHDRGLSKGLFLDSQMEVIIANQSHVCKGQHVHWPLFEDRHKTFLSAKSSLNLHFTSLKSRCTSVFTSDGLGSCIEHDRNAWCGF